jgi:imidazolonepropionase-like amidohydrolase
MAMGEDLIIRNITIIDGFGGAAMADAEVAIECGVFGAIRPSGTYTGGAAIYDGRGGYLLPGLWEGHTHLRAQPGLSPADQVAALESILVSYLAAGITTVLELGGPLDIDCSLRRRHMPPPPDAAQLFFAGPSFTGIDGWPLGLHHNRALVRETDDVDSARRMVFDLSDETDFVKCIYDGEPGAPDKLPRAVLGAIVSAAHERGKNVLVHIRTKRDIEEAVDAGADCIEHCFIPYDAADLTEAREVGELLARTGTYFSPTFTVFEQLGRSGDPAYLEDLVRAAIIAPGDAGEIAARPSFGAPFPHHPAAETLMRLTYGMRALPIMRDAGVKIAAGSDIAPFMSRPAALLRELQLLSAAGLSNGEVIVAATRHAAEKIGKGNTVGTIAPGAVADAVLVDADPLADVMHLVRPEHRVATLRHGGLRLLSS